MATIPLRLAVGSTGQRISYTPVEAILGGQVVEARAIAANPGLRACGVAGAASLLVAGVALHDIRATAQSIQDGAVVGIEHALTVVSYGIVPVTFSGAATRGQSLVATAAGQVAPAGAAPDARTLIGYCVSDSVSGAGVGLAFIKPCGG